jgi:hypothetical protein
MHVNANVTRVIEDDRLVIKDCTRVIQDDQPDNVNYTRDIGDDGLVIEVLNEDIKIHHRDTEDAEDAEDAQRVEPSITLC